MKLRLLPSKGDWSLGHVERPAGESLLEHVEKVLPEDGQGPLPNGGEPLPDAKPRDPSELGWAAGAMDGVLSVRGGLVSGNPPLAAASAILHLTRRRPDSELVIAALDRLNEVGGPSAVDEFLAAIAADRRADRSRLANLARWICQNGTRRGEVKCGMALLGVSGDESDLELLSRLGLLEELALYALVSFSNLLPDPEPATFDLARQLQGWGRIHGVQRLGETTNPIVQDWLIRGGAENSVMTEEVAYIAATAGRLSDALAGSLDEDLLDHAGELLRALAVGGPAEDMSDYAEAGDAMLAYVSGIEPLAQTLDRLEHVTALDCYVHGQAARNPHLTTDTLEALKTRLSKVLAIAGWADLVDACLRSPELSVVKRAASYGERFGIDAEPTMRGWLLREPLDAYIWQWLLAKREADELDDLLALGERLLPLDSLATGPADDLGLGRGYAAEACLEQILQRLPDNPGKGWNFVRIGLQNRVTRVRNFSIRVLKSWPRDSWPEEAPESLRVLLWREPNEKARQSIKELLQDT